MRTESKWMEQAIYVQDACNLCAVAQSFAKMCLDLHRAGIVGDALCKHPAIVLFVNKMESMVYSNQRFSEAYDICMKEVSRVAHEKLDKIIREEENNVS